MKPGTSLPCHEAPPNPSSQPCLLLSATLLLFRGVNPAFFPRAALPKLAANVSPAGLPPLCTQGRWCISSTNKKDKRQRADLSIRVSRQPPCPSHAPSQSHWYWPRFNKPSLQSLLNPSNNPHRVSAVLGHTEPSRDLAEPGQSRF